MKKPTLKICVGYHKPSLLLEGDCFVPIWGGKAVASEMAKDGKGISAADKQWMETHCIGDDTGDNISARNRQFCEATPLYWMWKNLDKLGNPDYIGFLQYRRHFVLNEEYQKKNYRENIYNLIVEDVFSQDSQAKIGLTLENLQKVLTSYDGIFCSHDTGQTVYDYKLHHHSQDIKYWNKALEIIKKDWPQYAAAAECYNRGTLHVWSNCFVMRREDFLEYGPFLFDVLMKIDRFAAAEYENMTPEQMRVPAYVSETMLGIFYTYLQQKNRNFKSVPLLYIRKPFNSLCCLPQHISPVKENAIPIVFIADNNYIKYTAVALQSIIAHSSKENFYDIIILENGTINSFTKQKVLSMLPPNFSCRFFLSTYYIEKYRFKNFWHTRLNLMPYLKGFIAEILKDYKKAIYLDGDIIFQTDAANLYGTELKNNLLGAVEDLMVTASTHPMWQTKRAYIQKHNKMQQPKRYFNSGVLVLNLSAIRQDDNFISNYIRESEFKDKERNNHDQDSLNFALEGKVHSLPIKYNFQCALLNERQLNLLSYRACKMMEDVGNAICIYHYDSDRKPWKNPSVQHADLWWKYARLTPFYEGFIYSLCEGKARSLIREVHHLSQYRIRYWKYRIFANFVWGKKRQRYNQKKKEYKAKIAQIKHMLKD